MPLFVLVLVILMAVPTPTGLIDIIQEIMSTIRFYRDNTSSSEITPFIYTGLPYICLLVIILLPSIACVYLYREVNRQKRSRNELESHYLQRLSRADRKAFDHTMGQKFYRRKYEACLQEYSHLQTQLAEAQCPHGKIVIGPDGSVTHTCCEEIFHLRRQIAVLGIQLAEKRRIRNLPARAKTIGEVMDSMVITPERWEPLLERVLPGLLARVKAMPEDIQKTIRSLKATVRSMEAKVKTLEASNDELHTQTWIDAKKAWDILVDKEELQSLVDEKDKKIRSLQTEADVKDKKASRMEHEAEEKDELIRSLESDLKDKITAEDRLKSRATEDEKRLSQESDKVARLQNENSDLKTQLAKKEESSRIEVAANQPTTIEAADTGLDESQAREIERLSALCTKHENTIKERDSTIATLQGDQGRLQEVAETRGNRIQDLEDGQRDTVANNASLQASAAMKDEQIRQLQLQLTPTAQSINSTSSGEHYETLDHVTRQAVAILGSLSVFPPAESTVTDLMGHINDTVETLKQDHEPLQKLRTSLVSLQNLLPDHQLDAIPGAIENEVDRMQKELSQLRQENANLSDELGMERAIREMTDGDNNNKEKEITKLEKTVKTLQDRVKQYDIQLGNLNNGFADLNMKAAQFEDENKQLRRRLSAANSDIADARDKINCLEAQITGLNDTKKDLGKSLRDSRVYAEKLRKDMEAIDKMLNNNKIGSPRERTTLRMVSLIQTYNDGKSRDTVLNNILDYLRQKNLVKMNAQGETDLFGSIKPLVDDTLGAWRFLDSKGLVMKDRHGNLIRTLFLRVCTLVEDRDQIMS
ncbi:hypothetical protein OHC33_002260 [Knufia fluminis]|uniref:Uncharacterized protein n=1 Tax=Knufia fluminis TaxID=191047 RepID=A0AAN8ER61_9EURO|nr:hypothetical protein OHC33_002260 [Knufia fluminis]